MTEPRSKSRHGIGLVLAFAHGGGAVPPLFVAAQLGSVGGDGIGDLHAIWLWVLASALS